MADIRVFSEQFTHARSPECPDYGGAKQASFAWPRQMAGFGSSEITACGAGPSSRTRIVNPNDRALSPRRMGTPLDAKRFL